MASHKKTVVRDAVSIYPRCCLGELLHCTGDAQVFRASSVEHLRLPHPKMSQCGIELSQHDPHFHFYERRPGPEGEPLSRWQGWWEASSRSGARMASLTKASGIRAEKSASSALRSFLLLFPFPRWSLTLGRAQIVTSRTWASEGEFAGPDGHAKPSAKLLQLAAPFWRLFHSEEEKNTWPLASGCSIPRRWSLSPNEGTCLHDKKY